ncbi:MAG: helix-turn-helix domain-containing protein [archaeon]
MDLSILEDLGLSNAEAKVYIALLESGSSKTGNIIKKAKLQSSTVYFILGSLIEKGLVTYSLQGKVKHFQAASPDNIISFLDNKKKRFQEILPDLKQKEVFGKKKNAAKVYEGMKGMEAAFNDILESMKKGEEYYFFQIANKNLQEKRIARFFRTYHLKRSEKGIKVKGLAMVDAKKPMEAIFKGIKHTKIKYVGEFTPTGLGIYKDKVITMDWDELTAIVMQSKSIANSYKKFFEDKWNKS